MTGAELGDEETVAESIPEGSSVMVVMTPGSGAPRAAMPRRRSARAQDIRRNEADIQDVVAAVLSPTGCVVLIGCFVAALFVVRVCFPQLFSLGTDVCAFSLVLLLMFVAVKVLTAGG